MTMEVRVSNEFNKSSVKTNHMQNESFARVDSAKFFYAICIVLLHSNILIEKESLFSFIITRFLFRQAVPFFFVTSGFFFAKKVWDDRTKLASVTKKYLFRLGKMLLIFESINVVLEVARSLLTNTLSTDFFIRMIKNIFFYPYGALWYIQASMVAIAILYFFLKRGWEKIALVIGMFLYIWALLCNNYYFLIEDTFVDRIVIDYMNVFVSARNGLFVGLIFVLLGIMIYPIYKQFYNKNSKMLLLILLILNSIIYFVEILLIKDEVFLDDGALYVSQLTLIPLLLLVLLIFNKKNGNVHTISNSIVLRNLSTGIYLLHRPILTLLFAGSGILSLNLNNSIIAFITITCSIGICLVSYRVPNKFISTLLK